MVHFKHEMIGTWQWSHRNFKQKWNFELTMFELSVADLYDCSFGFLENDSILLDLQADHIPCSC